MSSKTNHFVTVLVFLFLIIPFVTSADAESSHPHIVVIMVDDMGYGDPGSYNANSKIPMPYFDSLARDGMRFTDAHAPGPLCHLSRYGLLTGRYPFRAKPNQWRTQPTIAEKRMTIASLLKENGYQTAMVGKWHLGFAEDGYDKPLPGGPVDRGFQSYFGIRASTDIPPYFYIRGNRAVSPPTSRIDSNNSPDWSPIQGAFWRAGGIAPDLQLKDVLPRFTDEAVEVIEQHAKSKTQKPLMLYLAYPAPHTPWLPSRKYLGSSKASMYGDFTVMVDDMLGRVLKALEKAEMSDETLVVVTSDNGPVWYDSDVQRFNHDSSGGLRGMKADAWEAGHRMPFVVRWPGVVKAGSISQQTICFTDLLATFAEIVNVELPDEAGPDSFSLLPVLFGKQPDEQPIRPSFVMASGNRTMTVRIGDWKLIEGLGSGGFSKPAKVKPSEGGPTGQLYNLTNDPDESDNLFVENPDIVARLRAELKRVERSGRSR